MSLQFTAFFLYMFSVKTVCPLVSGAVASTHPTPDFYIWTHKGWRVGDQVSNALTPIFLHKRQKERASAKGASAHLKWRDAGITRKHEADVNASVSTRKNVRSCTGMWGLVKAQKDNTSLFLISLILAHPDTPYALSVTLLPLITNLIVSPPRQVRAVRIKAPLPSSFSPAPLFFFSNLLSSSSSSFASY